jgi:hypothetical protein
MVAAAAVVGGGGSFVVLLFHLFQTNFICTGCIPLIRIQPGSQLVGLNQNFFSRTSLAYHTCV